MKFWPASTTRGASDTVDARLGYAVGTAGDVNGDMIDDLVIGVPVDKNGEDAEGRAYVFHGPLSMTTSDCP